MSSFRIQSHFGEVQDSSSELKVWSIQQHAPTAKVLNKLNYALELTQDSQMVMSLMIIKKNPAYGRHWIFWQMRIISPLPWRGKNLMGGSKLYVNIYIYIYFF